MAAILVIEDVPAVLLSVKVVLEGKGHQVTGAADGIRGLDLLTNKSFDLVITDIWMPGSTGTEVIQQGRKRSPGTRFLAITGGDPNSAGGQGEARTDRFGADDILLKPFEKAELLSAVTRLLAVRAS